MTDTVATLWADVDRYITDLLVPADPALDAAIQSSVAEGLPQIHVAPNQGKFLHLLARIQGARRVLEIGTLAGYSTIWLARALPPGGKVVTLEADAKHAQIARANFARAGVAEQVELRLAPALETLPKLAGEGGEPFDLIFIDADKPSIPDYFTWSLRLSRPGTVIVVDNVIREGGVVNARSGDASIEGVRRFNEMLARESRVSATEIQTVGSKGYDGFAIALVIAAS